MATTHFALEFSEIHSRIKDAFVDFVRSIEDSSDGSALRKHDVARNEARDALLNHFANDNVLETFINQAFAEVNTIETKIGSTHTRPGAGVEHQNSQSLAAEKPDASSDQHDDETSFEDHLLIRFPSNSNSEENDPDEESELVSTADYPGNEDLPAPRPPLQATESSTLDIRRKNSASATSGTPSESIETATDEMTSTIRSLCRKRNVKLGRRYGIDLDHLTKIAISVGSPSAVVELFDALQDTAVKPTTESVRPFRDMDFAQMVHEVEHEHAIDHATHIIRRFQLHRMASFAHERKAFRLREFQESQRDIKEDEARPRLERHSSQRSPTKIASSAMKDVMREAYPNLEHDRKRRNTEQQAEYVKQWNALRDVLFRAERWYWLAEHYTRGILPLIPTIGAGAVLNESVEMLPPEIFQVLLEALKVRRGDFLDRLGSKLHSSVVDLLTGARSPMFIFKNVERKHLEMATYDSKDLVTYCGSIIPTMSLQRRVSEPLQ